MHALWPSKMIGLRILANLLNTLLLNDHVWLAFAEDNNVYIYIYSPNGTFNILFNFHTSLLDHQVRTLEEVPSRESNQLRYFQLIKIGGLARVMRNSYDEEPAYPDSNQMLTISIGHSAPFVRAKKCRKNLNYSPQL